MCKKNNEFKMCCSFELKRFKQLCCKNSYMTSWKSNSISRFINKMYQGILVYHIDDCNHDHVVTFIYYLSLLATFTRTFVSRLHFKIFCSGIAVTCSIRWFLTFLLNDCIADSILLLVGSSLQDGSVVCRYSD